jgi:hypothetical protein
MTNRQTAVLVTVAVVAGSIVAGVGLATRGSTRSGRVLQIDEVKGRVGSVVLGETRENVIGVLGRPRSERDSPSPQNFSFRILVYPHLRISLLQHRVVSIETDDPAARTLKVVRVGDPLSAARALYRKAARCVPNSPDKTAKHPHCRVAVPSGALLIGGDPIRTMTLVARSR